MVSYSCSSSLLWSSIATHKTGVMTLNSACQHKGQKAKFFESFLVAFLVASPCTVVCEALSVVVRE